MVKTKSFALGTYTVILSVCLLASCSAKSDFPNWLLGKWKAKFEGIEITEKWYAAKTDFKGTTIWSLDNQNRYEVLKLFKNEKQSLVYRVTMNGKTTDFVCDKPSDDSLIFINEANDFPKRLIYVKPHKDRMRVYIDNSVDDPNRMTFHFTKVK